MAKLIVEIETDSTRLDEQEDKEMMVQIRDTVIAVVALVDLGVTTHVSSHFATSWED
jgi:hypothetical protein